jgi:hypothetical protein
MITIILSLLLFYVTVVVYCQQYQEQLIDTQAFYIIFDDQIINSTFPDTVCQNNGGGDQGNQCVGPMNKVYKNGAIITQPMNITVEHINRLHKSIPGSIVLAYWCFDCIPIYTADECSTGHIMGDKPGRNCSTTYQCTDGHTPKFNKMVNDAFPKSWAQTNLGDNTIHCSYPGQAYYVPFKESADSLAAMLAEVVKSAHFDGVYLDGYVDPSNYKKPVMNSTDKYDFNGDNEADTSEDVAAQYEKYAPYFVQQIRNLIGDDKYIIANSAGRNPDPNLNGVTLEMEACVDLQKCTDALAESQQVSKKPLLSVLWLTHSEAMSSEDQCNNVAILQHQFPFVQVGTDFFDGSHVVCNNTKLTTY